MLYGTTYSGGVHNLGIIFSVDGNGENYKKLHDFDDLNGANPYQGLTQAPDGFLYGTTSYGGSISGGTIYKINPDGSGFAKLLDFFGTNGSSPYAAPLVGSDGNLYGTTKSGGLYSQGTIFKINTDGTGYTKLFDFSPTSGDHPYSSLIQDSHGTLYGVTTDGGTNNGGVIFSINTDGTGYTKLHEFNYQINDGSQSYGSLLLGKDGNLYGITSYGGSFFQGIVFSINTNGSAYTKLFDFNGTNAYAPIGSLIQLEDASLCGITSSGGANGSGIIFSIHTDGTGFKKIFDYPLAYGTGIARQNSLIALKLRKQSIHFNPIQEVTQGGPSFNLSASSSSSLPVTFSSSTSSLATVNGNSVTILSAGKASIVATQSGDGIYDAATIAQQSFCIDPLPPTISISGGGSSPLVLNSSRASGNQWLYNNSAIAGATNQTLQVSGPGNYAVKASVDNCFSQLSEVFVITEINDQSRNKEFSVYPNPSKNSINLNLENFQQGISVEIVIFNTLGQQMEYLILEGGKTSAIDVSKYPNGNFIITLAQTQKIYHSQFIKY